MVPPSTPPTRPRIRLLTEAGRQYVYILHRLTMERGLAGWTQAKEAEACAQLSMLWDRMDTAEQARAEQAVPHPADLIF